MDCFPLDGFNHVTNIGVLICDLFVLSGCSRCLVFWDYPVPRHKMAQNGCVKSTRGVIRPSSSLCCSPIVLVPNKDGTWHMHVDYRALNIITIKSMHPLPRIDDLLDQLKVQYFSLS